MAKCHPRPELHQARLLGGRRGLRSDSQPFSGAPQQRDVADRLDRCGRQEPLRLDQ